MQHLYGRLAAELRPGINDAHLLAALHPTPAVCGRPREDAQVQGLVPCFSNCPPSAYIYYHKMCLCLCPCVFVSVCVSSHVKVWGWLLCVAYCG